MRQLLPALTLALALAACSGDDAATGSDAGGDGPAGDALDAAVDAPASVDSPFDLDLGHTDQIQTLDRAGNRALSVDDDHHWVLWDLDASLAVARGDAITCEISFPCPHPLAHLRGGHVVIRTNTGLELRSAATGQITATVTTPTTPTTRVGAASDGSYAWAATTTGLRAWRADGTVLREVLGDYHRAIVFGAPTELRIGAGPAGAGTLETIRISDGMRTTATHNGSFHSWFKDGERFLTTTGTVVRAYSRTGVQAGFGMMPTLTNLTGQGDHVWTHAMPAVDNPLRIYAVTDLSTPLETTMLTPSDLTFGAGNTIGVVHDSTHTLEIITLGATITRGAPVPLTGASFSWYGADATGWMVGTRFGAVHTGVGDALVGALAHGRATNLRGTAGGVATLTTESGKVFLLHVDETPTWFRAFTLRTGHVELSADGATVVAGGPVGLPIDDDDYSLRVFDVATGAINHEWTYRQGDMNPFLDFSLAPAGDVLVHYFQNRIDPVPTYFRRLTALDGTMLTDYGTAPDFDALTGLRGVHLLSADGTRAAITAPYQYVFNAATMLYRDGVAVEVVDGVALGWLASDRLLIAKYRRIGNGTNAALDATTIYSGDGVVIAASPLPDIRPIESTGARLRGMISPAAGGLIYAWSKNAVYDPATGAVVWQGPAGGGAVAGDFVVYTQDRRVVIERYRP